MNLIIFSKLAFTASIRNVNKNENKNKIQKNSNKKLLLVAKRIILWFYFKVTYIDAHIFEHIRGAFRWFFSENLRNQDFYENFNLNNTNKIQFLFFN